MPCSCTYAFDLSSYPALDVEILVKKEIGALVAKCHCANLGLETAFARFLCNPNLLGRVREAPELWFSASRYRSPPRPSTGPDILSG
jgi:hypothetical protein